MPRSLRKISPLILTVVCISLAAQSELKLSLPFESKILNQQYGYSVYLPDDYTDSIDYPVLFLLHGFGGDETSWAKRANIKHLLDSLINIEILPPAVVVFPDGKKSYYINDYAGIYPFEDFFVNEFIPYIESQYAISEKISDRAIGGLSMGGFGAVTMTVKYPELFGTSINLSGAVRTPQQFSELTPVRYHGYFSHVYGDSLPGNDRITEHWKANSIYYLIDSTSSSTLKSIHWYIDCGTEDYLYLSNIAMHQLYVSFGIPHELHLRPGGHTWPFWKEGFINAMHYWGAIIINR
jgi:S-formylglutathione hydrolase FrmB